MGICHAYLIANDACVRVVRYHGIRAARWYLAFIELGRVYVVEDILKSAQASYCKVIASAALVYTVGRGCIA